MEDFKDHDNGQDRHLTTRRGFVTSVGFGVVSLYALWALYGAAPVSLAGIPSSGEGGGGHGGGHGGGGGMSPEEFRHLTDAFIEANELPDGSVQPKRMNMAATPMNMDGGHAEEEEAPQETAAAPMDMDVDHIEGEEPHGEVSSAEMNMEDDHVEEEGAHEEAAAGHDEVGEPGHSEVAASYDKATGQHDPEQPIDVYILAQRYSFEPDLLRLERNVPYRFRMMAVDTSHGVSVLGSISLGGHIMRARAKSLSEMTMTFTHPGEHLVYCTVYCGEGHDMMQAKIIVA